MQPIKVILLAGNTESTRIVFHSLKENVEISKVIIEEKIEKKKFLKRRIDRLGYINVMGQVLFQMIIVNMLKIFSKNRVRELHHRYQLINTPIPKELVINVTSVNAKACKAILEKENPDVVIVNGTRIIAKRILNSIDGPFLNTHAGITPKYRGVHGGYWALAKDDLKHFGVTVHKVDAGIDTGSVIYQKTIIPDETDNFVTYPLLQLAEGISLLKSAISDIARGELRQKDPITKDSKLYYHPTIWKYIYTRIIKGVK